MGRIDDALRRSGASDTTASSDIPEGNVFVSPWSVSSVSETEPIAEMSTAEPNLSRESETVPFREPETERADLLTGSRTADAELSAQFRRMAATMYNAQGDGDLKLVLVTSAAPGEGKTLTAANVALILSESFRQRVLLIDADLRRPSLHRVWGVGEEQGLSDLLKSATEHEPIFVQLSDTLTLLPAGRPDSDPTGGLTSDPMRRILIDARARFDWVLIDSPPIAAVDDATLLGSMVDAVVFVVRARKTRSAIVRRAVESIGRDRVFGLVLNGTEASDSPTYGYDGYRYPAAG